MVKCKSLRINMLRITHTGKSVNFPVTIDPMMLAAYSSSMKYNNDCWNLSSIILSHDTRISPKQLQFHYTKQPFLVHLHANFSFIRRPSLFYQK